MRILDAFDVSDLASEKELGVPDLCRTGVGDRGGLSIVSVDGPAVDLPSVDGGADTFCHAEDVVSGVDVARMIGSGPPSPAWLKAHMILGGPLQFGQVTSSTSDIRYLFQQSSWNTWLQTILTHISPSRNCSVQNAHVSCVPSYRGGGVGGALDMAALARAFGPGFVA